MVGSVSCITAQAAIPSVHDFARDSSASFESTEKFAIEQKEQLGGMSLTHLPPLI